MTRGSLLLFALTYFPHILTSDIPKFHRDLYSLFKPGRSTPRVMRMLDIEPRGHGKSARWSIIYPLWLLLTDPYELGYKRIDIFLLSYTATKSEDWMTKMDSELSGNEALRYDWGDQLGGSKVNNRSDKILANGARIRARGMGGQIRGDHPSDIIVDDLEDRVESQNPEIRKKVQDYYSQDMFLALEAHSSLILVGTIIHQEGLLNTLWKDEVRTKGWVKRKYSGLDENGDPIWPSYRPKSWHEATEREIGALAYTQEILNNPIASENPTIRPEWIQYYTAPPMRPREMYVVTAIDTASGEKKVNDYTAIATIGILPHGDSRGDLYVLAIERGRWSMDEKKRKFFNHIERYGSDRGIVEINFDPSFMTILKDEARRRRVFNTVLVPVKAKPREDKLVRLESVSNLFQNGRLFFLREHRDAINEILLMPNGTHDDMADAIVWGLRDLKRGYMRRMSAARGLNSVTMDSWYGG